MYSPRLSRAETLAALGGEFPGGDPALSTAAREVMLREVGSEVRLRGLLEFSNRCSCDCCYCGIRRSMRLGQRRFTLSTEKILQAARLCQEQGFGSITLQAGERQDAGFVDFVENVVLRIKQETADTVLPNGLGITLSLGVQSTETYQRWHAAGAHRYLLRIETSNRSLFEQLHPPEQRFCDRMQALKSLKTIGYQLGTGVMIGIPGQTNADLARDIDFFRTVDADMIGMGPYIDAPGAPAAATATQCRLQLSLRMIAAVRLQLGDVNIAAATALQALAPTGREQGLMFGANVLMPIITPPRFRAGYQLYDGKPCIEDTAENCVSCTPLRARRVQRPVSHNSWGDAPHAQLKENMK